MVSKQARNLLAIVTLLSLFLYSAISWSQTINIDQVLVIVDSDAITLSEYKSRHHQERIENTSVAAFSGEVNQDILETMIDERIQVQQARTRGINVSEKEIDAAIQFIASQNSLNTQALEAQLNRDGFTLQQFRDSLKRQQFIRKLVDVVANSRVVISDQEIENYLKTHTELGDTDQAFEVSHLFILTKDKSDNQIQAEMENIAYIRGIILDGESFETAVKNYSDSSNREDGGYLGWRTPDQLPELFIDTLREMTPGENSVSEVLQSENGLHLLKLHDLRGAGKVVTQQLVRHILLQPSAIDSEAETLEFAQSLYQQLIDGESFERLARLHSKDAQSRKDGGSLGWVNPGTLVPAFEKVANSLPLKTISTPVRSRFGYHIIQVLDRREADMSNELAINQARQALFRRKADELYDNWFKAIRRTAFIEYIGI